MADPRQALIQQMMQSQRGSPDLPSRGAVQELNNSGDAGWKQFIDQFGLERERNPNGPPPGYIPMPRPRMPDMQVGSSPLGDEALQPPAAGLKTSDVMRNMQDAPYETVDAVQNPQMTDEDMLDNVHSQMGGGDWEGDDSHGPTRGDIKAAMDDEAVRKKYVDYFGEEPEESLKDINSTGPDPDDQGD